MAAGFLPKGKDSVGVWITKHPTSRSVDAEVAIDLLVPASVSPGTGRRAARLPGHNSQAARIVKGLDGAIVDWDTMRLAALTQNDSRSFQVRVAGGRGPRSAAGREGPQDQRAPGNRPSERQGCARCPSTVSRYRDR
jgi:hypothetical protein